MKSLFIARTPYQLLVSIRLIEQCKLEGQSDLLLGTEIGDVEKLYASTVFSGFFENVNIFDSRSLGSEFNKLKANICKKYNKCPSKILRDIFILNDLKKYDYSHLFEGISMNMYSKVFLSNIGPMADVIYFETLRYPNKVELNCFEDGLATYYPLFPYQETRGKKSVIKMMRKYYNNCFRPNYCNKGNNLFLFNPNHIEWIPSSKVIGIDKITAAGTRYVELTNQIFDYTNFQDIYDRKIIFFEEAHHVDGYKINDVDLVHNISKIVGKDNIMVKIHPRSPVNRFKELGYKTNENMCVPWEVIAQNIDLSDKILITIASGSVLNPLINMGIRAKKTIFLMKFNKEIDSNLSAIRMGLQDKMYSIVAEFKDDVISPSNMDELEDILSKLV